jgi:DNA-binding beta-propeller fold protein YncE
MGVVAKPKIVAALRKPDRKGLAVALLASCGLAFSVSVAWAVGELTQKPGAAGCISQGGSGGCRPGVGLLGASSIATSPDGKSVYVASAGSDAVAIFNRNDDGTLEQLPGTAGCVSQGGSGGCRPGIGLNLAHGVATSPDGRNVYVASTFSNAVAIFSRNPDGTLDQLPDIDGCISEGGSGGCRPGNGLVFPFGISVSPDGKSVYVVSGSSNAIAILSRNPDGTLEQLSGTDGCISENEIGAAGCQPGIGLRIPISVTTSSNGKSVYVASGISDTVAIFNRRPDGTLEQLPGTDGCISQGGRGGCQPGIGLDGAESVTASPDGKSVYLASHGSDAVAIFKRNDDGTLEQLPGTAGCVSQGGSGGCRPSIGLDFASGVATSPDGRNVYVASASSGGDLDEGSDAVAIFNRNADGTLEQPPGPAGCISQDGIGGCRPGIGLNVAISVAISPDGKSVYVASAGSGDGSDAVAIFDRAGPPAPSDTSAPTISGFRLAPKRFKASPKGRSSFRFRLSEAAAARIEVDRVRPGRKVGKRCEKPTPNLSKHPRCKRFIGVGKTLNFQNRSAGANKIAFNGKVSGRALKPGIYRARITAKDAAGNSSTPKNARFTVLRPRK